MPGNNGTVVGTVTYGTSASGFGGSTGAIITVGSGGYVTVPNPATVVPNTTTLSISAHIKTTSVNSEIVAVNGVGGIEFAVIGGGVCRVRFNAGASVLTGVIPVNDGTNYHTCKVIITAGTVALWIDGVADGSLAGYTGGNYTSISIGYDVTDAIGGATQLFIDELAFFTTATSTASLAAPYVGNESGLVALYHFDNGTTDGSITPITPGKMTQSETPNSPTVAPTGVLIVTGVATGGSGTITATLYYSATAGFVPPGAGTLIGSTTNGGLIVFTPPDTGLYYVRCVYSDSASTPTTAVSFEIGVALNRGPALIIGIIGDSLLARFSDSADYYYYVAPASGTTISFTYNGVTTAGTNLVAFGASAATLQAAFRAAAGGVNSGLGLLTATVTAITGATNTFVIIIPVPYMVATAALTSSSGTITPNNTFDPDPDSINLATTFANIVASGAIYRKWHVFLYNAAVSGQTTTSWQPGGAFLPTFLTNIAPGGLYTTGVNWVHIMLGTNDCAAAGSAGTNLPASTFLTNMQNIVAAVLTAAPATKIMIHYPPFPSPGSIIGNTWLDSSDALIQQYQTQIKTIIAAHPGVVFLGDTISYQVTAQNPLLYDDDGIHQNTFGTFAQAQNWADALFAVIDPVSFGGGGVWLRLLPEPASRRLLRSQGVGHARDRDYIRRPPEPGIR